MSSNYRSFLMRVRMDIKKHFNESLSENVLDILMSDMLKKGEPITYESIVKKTYERQGRNES